jgi:iron complex outermembrane recepter protein
MRTLQRFNSRFGIGALLVATAFTLVAATPARAVNLDQQVVFAIEPQNLGSALIDFSGQTNLQVMSDGSAVKDRQAPGVHGRYAIGQALDLLLAGSGLSYKAAGPNTIAVVAAAARASADPPVEPQIQTAQAGPGAPIEKIEVTGSHILRSEAEAVQNVQVISAQDIKSSGQETVVDYLRTISSTFGNSINESFTNSFAPGSAMVGLRGLTQKDTLVLVNGRRITNYGLFQNLSDSFVDLNSIPLAAVERIEILRSGGSAIYGSDAIAGVINIILKQNTTEKTVEGGGRLTTDGGAATRDVDVLFGYGNLAADDYNVVFSASAFKRDQLLFSQRDNTKNQDYRGQTDGILDWLLANQYQNAPRKPFASCGANGLPGQALVGSHGLGCYYNDADQLALLPGAKRANLSGNGNLRLNADWTAFADVFYSNEETTSTFIPFVLRSSNWVFNPATGGIRPIPNVLPGTNPAALNSLPTPIDFTFQSVGPRNYEVVSNTYRVSGGLKGTWQAWEWEGAYGHSENAVTQDQHNGINAQVLQSVIQNNTYSFLNPLSTPGASRALAINYGNSSTAKLDTFDLKGTGGLFDLLAGTVTAAVGMEFRRESVNDQPNDALAQGLVTRTGVTRVDAGRDIYAGYVELDVPILKSLEVDAAGREEHYQNTGSKFTPQATLRWQPVRQFSLRMVGAKGFRAPSLAESSNSTSVANQGIFDPVLMRPDNVGYITGGNPKVQPETSDNLDIGLVFSPLNSINLSVDYYSIWLHSVIAPNATANQIVNNPTAYPPGSLVRGPDGSVIYAKALYTNQFDIRTDGLDISGDLTFPLPDASKLKFILDATYVPTFLINQGPGAGWAEFAGTNGWNYASPISGGGPVPRWKGSATARWENAEWTAQVVGRYVDRYFNYASVPSTGFGLTQQSVSAFNAIDLYGQYRGLKNWKFSISVVNLFNNEPPYDSAALLFFSPNGIGGGTIPPYDPVTYDDLGRMVDLHVSYSF